MRTQEIKAYRSQALHVLGQLLRISAVRALAEEARRLSAADVQQLTRAIDSIEHNYHELDRHLNVEQKVALMEARFPQLLMFGALLMQFSWGHELVDSIFAVREQRNIYSMV